MSEYQEPEHQTDASPEEVEPPSLALPGMDVAMAELSEVPPVYEPPEPPEPAEPGLYLCEDPDPGIHPVLGRLVEGENDFTGLTHPDSLLALAALVEAGVLRKV